jgi:hypothetical protein
LAVDVDQAEGQGHLDAFVLSVEGDEEGFCEGDQDFFAVGGLDGEEGGSFVEAAAAIGCGREVDVDDGAYRDRVGWVGVVEDDAADEVADVVGVFFELDTFGGGDDDIKAC